MALDGAGRHQRQALSLAPPLRLLKLPPGSPELNPVERLRDDLRESPFTAASSTVSTPLKSISNHRCRP